MKHFSRIIIISLILTTALRMTSLADIEPFYNFSVAIDQPDKLNEKIEIYVEKNGEYYGDYDLNINNSYQYKQELPVGNYRIYARVRYDADGIYQINPEYQELEITVDNYNKLNDVVFKIIGGSIEEDGETWDYGVMDQSPINPENVYSLDRIDELRKVQQEGRERAYQALLENEEWESTHNFLAQKEIEETQLADHYYPEIEDMTEISENEVTETDFDKENQDNEKKKNQQSVSDSAKIILNVCAVISVILLTVTSARLIGKHKKKERKK